MCDYSLEAYQSRPAAVGEKLTLERFPSGSMGFASGKSCDLAICVAADAKLRLEGIGEAVQKEYGVGPIEEVVMTRLEGGSYKDAVRFANGKEVLLQRLDCGLSAVLVAASSDLIDIDDIASPTAVREPELVYEKRPSPSRAPRRGGALVIRGRMGQGFVPFLKG